MKDQQVKDLFAEFLTDKYYKELTLATGEGKKSIGIDFSLLDRINPDLADLVLEKPGNTFVNFEDAIGQIDLPEKTKLKVRVFNIPENNKIRIRNVRAEHIGRLICVDGMVKRASEVRPEISEVVFECPDCQNRMTVIQTEKDKSIKYPTKCDSCRCRRGFKQIRQKLYDARWVAVEEPFEITTGEKPSEIMVYMKEDLTSPRMQSKTDPGNRIKIVGILKEVPKITSRGKKTRQMELLIDANNIESSETEWGDLVITPKEEKEIKKLSKDPKVYEKLVASIAPTMYGLEKEKLAIALQLFGGVPHLLKDNTRIRGDIHILLIGDPSTGKSQLLKLTSQLIPRGKYVSGKGVTGAGLTAAVVRDEQFLGGWVLEAGALVLANNSLISIDEFEKMEKTDQVAMHEALSIQTVSIAKAAIVATLPARTSVLAGGNPKLGRFDPYIPIKEQIDIPETLLSRFDIKFALRDLPKSDLDEKMVDHILKSRHFDQEEMAPFMEPEMLRKYIAYAKKNIKPKLTRETGDHLKKFYIDMRAKAGGEDAPIPITLRQYEALIRMSEASAKIQLRKKVNMADADRAIDIMKYSLRQFGFDRETGFIDIDRAEGAAATSAQRSKIRIVLDIINELTETTGKMIPVDEITRRSRDQGVENADQILRKMKNEGMIFEPRPNHIQKI